MRILLFALLLTPVLQAIKYERTILMPELMKPGSILVLDNRCFVSQQGLVLAFDLSHGGLIHKFGKRGSGPGEFRGVIRIHNLNGNVMVSSLNKVSVFSPEGRLLKEMTSKLRRGISAGGFLPMDKGFIAASSISSGLTLYRTVNIFDKNLKFVKEIFRSPVGSSYDSKNGKNNFFKSAFSYRVAGNRIFVAGGKGFAIDIFDLSGNLLSKIYRDFKAVPFTKSDRLNFLKYLKDNSPDFVFKNMYRRFVFPETFPVIFFLVADGEVIYVLTWRRNNEGLETFIYNLNGESQERIFLPIRFNSPVAFSPFTIMGGKIYQLIEDEEEELWSLKITSIL